MRRVRRSPLVVSVVVAALIVAGQALAAQEVRGTVRDTVGRAPIAGAVLTLLDSAGTTVGRNITDADGRFRLVGIGATRRLRVTRIGFRPRTVELPPHDWKDVLTIDVAMAPIPTLLEPVRVASGAVCPARDDRAAALSLLEQARAGLLSAVVAREKSRATMIRLVYRRTLDDRDQPDSQEVRVDSSSGVTRSFLAVRPAADFVRLGFRADSGVDQTYFAPDAETLLDDAFRDGYCFELARADRARPNQIGLRFVAARTQRGHIDIDATLWIDSTARELRSIDYRYTNIPRGPADVNPGGTIEFRQLANGVTLIDRWHIRLPAVRQDTSYAGGIAVTHTYFVPREAGGEVATAAWPDGFVWRAELGTVRLRTVDRAGAAASGVRLHLPSTSYVARSDSTGVAEIARLLPGPYRVTVIDSSLARIGVELETPVRFFAKRGAVEEIPLTVPTAIDYVRAGCKDVYRHEPDNSAAWLVGRIYDERGHPVRARWQAFRVTPDGASSGIPDAKGTTSSDGLFFGCGGYGSHDRIVVSVYDPEVDRWVEIEWGAAGRLTVIRADLARARVAQPFD